MSLDYSSLVTGLGPVMPDVEEDVVDSHRPALTSASASLVASAAVVDDDDDDDEFLPTVDPSNRVRDIHLDDEENPAMSKFDPGCVAELEDLLQPYCAYNEAPSAFRC